LGCGTSVSSSSTDLVHGGHTAHILARVRIRVCLARAPGHVKLTLASIRVQFWRVAYSTSKALRICTAAFDHVVVVRWLGTRDQPETCPVADVAVLFSPAGCHFSEVSLYSVAAADMTLREGRSVFLIVEVDEPSWRPRCGRAPNLGNYTINPSARLVLSCDFRLERSLYSPM
jgi:hypothetical protein